MKARWYALAFILCCFFLWYQSLPYVPEAAIYPRTLMVIIVALSVFLFISDLRRPKDVSWKWVPLITFAVCLGYFFLLYLVGFGIATAIFLPTLMYIQGVRKWLTIALCTLGVELFIYFVFVIELHVPLPKGIWGI
ncbi:tripartite tricarboxylate transporter TctB family protein [Gelria sp. Kuro-4]|uniref:tripartite tricarboxylate transporter TctB family protein n=1 Tax=Gelria sp. Kuro-4 TaxID=2796927 RepID=UPI001C813BC7